MREVATMSALRSDTFGASSYRTAGDDTVVMEAADAALAFPPPIVFPTRRRAQHQPRQPTMTPGPMPVLQPSRSQQAQSPHSKTLNLNVDKVIEYLDSYRFTLSQDEIDEPPRDENASSFAIAPKAQHTKHLRPPTPRGKIFRRTAETTKALRSVLSDSTNGEVEGTRTSRKQPKHIFRGANKNAGPSIVLANSVHSQQSVPTPVHTHQQRRKRKENEDTTPKFKRTDEISPEYSFLNDYDGGDVESCVTNLITSMCVEQEQGAAPFDWEFLDKMQGQVETLLREVRMEREATNEWVMAVRTSVDKWVDEQRLLIDCERKHALERRAEVMMQQQQQQEREQQKREQQQREQQHREQQQREQQQREQQQREQQQRQEEEIADPVPLKEEKLQVIIQKQAQQIEALESRLAETTLQKSSTPTVLALETPRYSPTIPAVGGEESFFASLAKQESPILPHVPQEKVHPKREYATMKDGRRLIKFRNGTEREYLTDGTIITRYTNGDVKTDCAGTKDNKVVIYWHDEEETKQTIHPDGTQVYEYPNRQIERHYPDGRKEVDFPHGVRRKLRADGSKQSQRSL